jgi:hypothetical protein
MPTFGGVRSCSFSAWFTALNFCPDEKRNFPGSRKANWGKGHHRRACMAAVAGVDFGTLSVRVSIVDSERGLLASAIAEYPLHRKREDPEYVPGHRKTHSTEIWRMNNSASE